SLFLENHDQPRSVSTWGNDTTYRTTSAKSLATMYFLMRGTPFIYQGQEIGMTNVQFDYIDDYNDVAIKNMYKNERANGKSHQDIMDVIWKSGRDNSRTPMQWNQSENAGFTSGNPWMKVNPNYKTINVEESLVDGESIYHYYKRLIQLRKEYEVLIYGNYELILPNHETVFAYIRTLNDNKIVVLANLFEEETSVVLPEEMQEAEMNILISNYSVDAEGFLSGEITFKPFEARVYEVISGSTS